MNYAVYLIKTSIVYCT